MVGIALASAIALLTSSCSSFESQNGASSETELEVVAYSPDEDGPRDVREAFAQSDYVVVASIDSVADGACFYGDTVEDPDSASIIFEDVLLNITVLEALKGPPDRTLSVRWPAFITTSRSSEDRTAMLDVAGVTLNGEMKDGTYLMFLAEYDEPFGLSPVALSAALIELGSDEKAVGQISSTFERYRDLSLPEILREAEIRR